MLSRRDAIIVSYDSNNILPNVDETVASHAAVEDSATHPGSGDMHPEKKSMGYC